MSIIESTKPVYKESYKKERQEDACVCFLCMGIKNKYQLFIFRTYFTGKVYKYIL